MVTDEIVQFESDRYNVPPVNNFLDNQQVLEIVEKNTLTLNFTNLPDKYNERRIR